MRSGRCCSAVSSRQPTVGRSNLTIVNIMSPQDVKIWEPTSITAK